MLNILQIVGRINVDPKVAQQYEERVIPLVYARTGDWGSIEEAVAPPDWSARKSRQENVAKLDVPENKNWKLSLSVQGFSPQDLKVRVPLPPEFILL